MGSSGAHKALPSVGIRTPKVCCCIYHCVKSCDFCTDPVGTSSKLPSRCRKHCLSGHIEVRHLICLRPRFLLHFSCLLLFAYDCSLHCIVYVILTEETGYTPRGLALDTAHCSDFCLQRHRSCDCHARRDDTLANLRMMGRVRFRYVGVSCFLLCALVLLNLPVTD